MAQQVKVQDGNIVYAAADPAHSVNFGVNGQLNVTKELNVGDDPFADGVITAPPNVDLIISTDGTGNLRFEPGASIVLNNVVWPDGTVSPVPGMFLGVTSLNNLQFTSFIIGLAPSDNESDAALNILFPTAYPGQFAVGPTTLYQSLGSGNWRQTGMGIDYTVPFYIPLNETYKVNNNKQALYHMPITVDGDLVIDGFLIEV